MQNVYNKIQTIKELIVNKGIFRLYHRPSFWEGVARLFDFTGKLNKYNISESGDEADYRAIRSDWQHVGQDLSSAISEYEEEHGSRQRTPA